MKYAAIVPALISLACGLVAARYWYDSSKVKIDPAWELEIRGDVGRSECRIDNINPNHAMILPHDANPKPDGIFRKDRF